MSAFAKNKPYVLILAAVILAVVASRAVKSPGRRPNVILITVDALRADHLGCYGYKRKITPNIDKLAEQGIVFTQAISQAPFTPPSLSSVMTARYPNIHKVESWRDSIDESFFTLAQILKKQGFSTGGICAHDFFVTILGFDKGFDSLSSGGNLSAAEITGRAARWLKENRGKRFFLWLHYFDPHEPYRPPAHTKKELVDSISRVSGGRQVPVLSRRPSDPDIYGGIGGIPDYAVVDARRDIEYYIALYDAEIKYADEQIGILLKELEQAGLEDDTLIILSADHGEAMGEHDLYFTHGEFLYDELIRVPLIVKFRRMFPVHKVIDRQVRLVDIMPTILHISEIKSPCRTDGISLLPLMLGEAGFPSLYAFSEIDEKRSVRTPEWKLICNGPDSGEYELYDLVNDPGESVNLAAKERRQFKFLKQKLDDYLRRGSSTAARPKQPLDRQTVDKLKSLGYLH